MNLSDALVARERLLLAEALSLQALRPVSPYHYPKQPDDRDTAYLVGRLCAIVSQLPLEEVGRSDVSPRMLRQRERERARAPRPAPLAPDLPERVEPTARPPAPLSTPPPQPVQKPLPRPTFPSERTRFDPENARRRAAEAV